MQPKPREESFTTLLEAVGCTLTTPSRHGAGKEAQSLLETAMARLPDSYRQVVQLYDLEGQTVQQVAKSLARSPGAVYMLRARAHNRLRELLGSRSKFFGDSA